WKGKTVRALAFAPNSALLAAGGDDKAVTLWDADAGTVAATLTDAGKAVECLAFSPDGKTLAAGSADKVLYLWNVADRKYLRGLTFRWWDVASKRERPAPAGPSGLAMGVAVSADGRRAVTTHEDAVVRVWDAETGGLLATLHGHESQVLAGAVAPDGRTCYTAG